MQNTRITQLNAVLSDMDETTLLDGSLKYFSIGFYTVEGSYVFLARARKTGVRQNMFLGDYKGVTSVNQRGEDFGHPYPVYIHFIREYTSPTLRYRHEG